jgi:hypothetical protein
MAFRQGRQHEDIGRVEVRGQLAVRDDATELDLEPRGDRPALENGSPISVADHDQTHGRRQASEPVDEPLEVLLGRQAPDVEHRAAIRGRPRRRRSERGHVDPIRRVDHPSGRMHALHVRLELPGRDDDPGRSRDRHPLEQRIEARLHVRAGDASDLSVSISVGDHEGRPEEPARPESGDHARKLHDAKDLAAPELLAIDERKKERVRSRRPGTALGEHDDSLAQQRIAREVGEVLVEVAEVVHGAVRGGVVAKIVGQEPLVLTTAPQIREAAAERRQDSDGRWPGLVAAQRPDSA